ncbi:MAG: hypothetical protein ABF685_14795 [Clostridium saccharoperbutylacetonicum]
MEIKKAPEQLGATMFVGLIKEKDSNISGNTLTYETYISDLKSKLVNLKNHYNSLNDSISINIIRIYKYYSK